MSEQTSRAGVSPEGTSSEAPAEAPILSIPEYVEGLVTRARQAANRLQALIDDLSSPAPVEADFLADSLLRALSSQPARPSDRDPYRGLVMLPESAPFTDYRVRAADALKIYIDSINEPKLGSKDAVIDDVIRKVTPNPLPGRPINRLPYEGLFPTATGITVG